VQPEILTTIEAPHSTVTPPTTGMPITSTSPSGSHATSVPIAAPYTSTSFSSTLYSSTIYGGLISGATGQPFGQSTAPYAAPSTVSFPGLPPPVRPAGEVSSATSTIFAVEPPAAVHESYSGTISIPSGTTDENRALVLELNFTGDEIAGTATLAGYETFSIQGKVYPRGIELNLNNSSVRLRLSGGRSARSIRGRYVSSQSDLKGSWEVVRVR
jgi:hypothetical protein